MPPSTRSSKRRRRDDEPQPAAVGHRRAEADHRRAAFPIEDLPLETLALIFQCAVEAGGLRAAFTLSHVSHTWRQLALQTPTLWSDARHNRICFEPEQSHHRTIDLLTLCSERSHDAITHVKIPGFVDDEEAEDCAVILWRSAATIRDLELRDAQMCLCASCVGRSDREEIKAEHRYIFRELTPFPAMIHLAFEATSLERLVLQMDISPEDVEPEHPPFSRPKEVLITAIVSNKGSIPVEPYAAHLDQLTSEVQHFGLLDDYLEDWDWRDWAWATMLRRAEHLLSLQSLTHLDGLRAPNFQVINFPVLRHFKLYGNWLCDDWHEPDSWEGERWAEPLARPLWFNAPALRTIRSCPHLARKVHCPLVEAASLILAEERDLEPLSELLASWPELDTLVFEVDPNAASEGLGESEGTRAVQEILGILKLTTGRAVLCPKLRRLGLIWAQHNGRYNMEHSVEWSAVPWWHKDVKNWYKPITGFKMFRSGLSDPRPELGTELLDLEAQRRGGTATPRPSNSDFNGPFVDTGCRALESIKLAGMRAHPTLWRRLLRSSQAVIDCYPDPCGPPPLDER